MHFTQGYNNYMVCYVLLCIIIIYAPAQLEVVNAYLIVIAIM